MGVGKHMEVKDNLMESALPTGPEDSTPVRLTGLALQPLSCTLPGIRKQPLLLWCCVSGFAQC